MGFNQLTLDQRIAYEIDFYIIKIKKKRISYLLNYPHKNKQATATTQAGPCI